HHPGEEAPRLGAQGRPRGGAAADDRALQTKDDELIRACSKRIGRSESRYLPETRQWPGAPMMTATTVTTPTTTMTAGSGGPVASDPSPTPTFPPPRTPA